MSVDEAVAAAGKLPGPVWVVKSQIHAGGRGKGKFKEAAAGDKGGVRLAKSLDEVKTFASQMLNNTLVTIQTGSDEGKKVQRCTSKTARHRQGACIYRRWSTVPRRAYRSSSRPKAAWTSRRSPTTRQRRSITFSIDPASGYTDFHGRKIAFALGLTGDLVKQCVDMVGKLYKLFVEKDMSLLEINPLVVTKDNKLVCLDGKMDFDGNALFRHKEIMELRDISRGRSGRGRSLQVRPRLRQTRRHHRLPGQRRRPCHGDHGYHQALRL